MLKILLFSGGAGIIGTGTGGLIGLIFGRKSDGAVSCLLSFAAGVMLSVVFFDLIPEAVALSSLLYAICYIAGGVICTGALHYVIDITAHTRRRQKGRTDHDSMLTSGLLIFIAIALHNLPEGMAIGSGGIHDERMGLTLAILIAIHDMPEGVSVCVPLIEGSMKRSRAFWLTVLSGTPTLIGGLIGIILGHIDSRFIAASLAFAGGAMLYVTLCEMLPRSARLNPGRRPAIFAAAGVLFGMAAAGILS
jgi:ZIP family zinc transporter